MEIKNVEEEERRTTQQQFNNNIVVDGGDKTGRCSKEGKVVVLDDQEAHNKDRAMTSSGRIEKEKDEDIVSSNVVVGISDTAWSGEKCLFDRDKKCIKHGVQATVYQVTSKKWSYMKNKKSYGWKTRKVEKLACRMRSS